MGLIKAGIGALGGTLADQWKEFFYCESMPKEVLVTKGQKRISGRSSNTKGNDNIISNGSGIAVADGQCMIIVEQGKVVEVCAEPGQFTYDASTEPSIFYGTLGESVKDTFKTVGKRFTYGGDTGKDQRVYYFNTKELIDNKFGTPNPIPFRVVDSKIGLDVDVSVRCSGVYSYKIADPLLFYTTVCGNVEQEYTREELDGQLKTFIDGCIQKFLSVDKLAVHMQTHSTLTCCRAILRMHRVTKDARYLARAREVFALYVSHGMTLTYENFNWFGREDTWTEPCAVTDSLIAALDLYQATSEAQYLTLARRIWLNGFRLCQRINGGAGPNSCVTVRNGVWEMRMYEAYFCCTMRTAEGLYRAREALDLLLSEADADACRAPEQDGFGRWMCGDRLLCSINGGTLAALPDIMEVGEEELKTLRLQIVFPKGEGL